MSAEQRYFVNPDDPLSAERLAALGGQAIRVMADIYASGGCWERMRPETLGWLNNCGGSGVERVLIELLGREVGTRRFDHRFMGQIHPQGNEIGVLASLVAAYMNTNTVVREVSTAENCMENEVVTWLADMFGYDYSECSGNVVAGGTTANITALWVARERKIAELQDKKVHRRGLPLYVLGTEMAHYSVMKACDLLGRDVVYVKMPTKGFRTDVQAVEKVVRVMSDRGKHIMALVGLAGETETGLVDDLGALADIANKHEIFYHVDAAYGGPFILTKRASLFDGISRADSITVDPHKMLYTPYSAGVILFRDKRCHMLIGKGMREAARYLLKSGERMEPENDDIRNFGMTRVEGSMGAAGVLSTWATIKLFGKEGIRNILEHKLNLADYAYSRALTSDVVEPLFVPETNTLLLGLRSSLGFLGQEADRVIEGVVSRLDNSGYYISCNGEINHGMSAFRFVAMHPWTTHQEVDELFALLESEVQSVL